MKSYEIHIIFTSKATFPSFFFQVSQVALLIAGLLLLTGLCHSLLIFGSILALFTGDALLAAAEISGSEKAAEIGAFQP